LEHFVNHYHNLAEGNIKFIVNNASAGPLTSAVVRSQLQCDLHIVHLLSRMQHFQRRMGYWVAFTSAGKARRSTTA
jgi:hypothetical protein